MKIALIKIQRNRYEKISLKLLNSDDIKILNVVVNQHKNHREVNIFSFQTLYCNMIKTILFFYKKSKSIIVFITIDALTFLNFDDDSLTNRNLFIELRDNVFFMFFKFMILTFVHEFLSRKLIMLLFFAICINVENDSKSVFDFKFGTIFFFFETITFHSWKNVFDFMNFATTNLKISRIVCDFFCEIQSHFNATR
jgi:hypothetical protein